GGYNTYMTGKWHLGQVNRPETSPIGRGFERVFASPGGAAHLGPLSWGGPGNATYWDGENVVEVGDDFYSTRVYTEKLIEFIEADRRDDKPFFAWFAPTAPH